MVVAFDATTQPMGGLWEGGLALAALAACFVWRYTGRTLKWYVPAVIVLIGGFAGGVPIWEHYRISRILATGEGVRVSRGTISQTWHISERRRDFSSSGSSSIRYKTVVSEGFDVGPNRFSWVRGSCLSNKALCSLARTKIPLVRGMEVEVTWFPDPAQGNERRVLRLLASPRG